MLLTIFQGSVEKNMHLFIRNNSVEEKYKEKRKEKHAHTVNRQIEHQNITNSQSITREHSYVY